MEIRRSIALVTGANRGIGRAIVGALLEHDVTRVYASARRVTDLEDLASCDRRIVPLQIDVTDEHQVAAAAATATDVNLLINNAGVLEFGSVLDAPAEAFERNLSVNFYGLLRTTRAFAPALVENKGSVVDILTLVALASMPGLGVYNASKAAAWSLTQSLRADFAKRGVRVFAVFPGAVDTDMLRGVDMPKTAPQLIAREVIAGIEAGTEDIFPDVMSKQIYGAWAADHKAVERQFAVM